MAPRELSYVTTDVFTTQRYQGNPLAIVRLPTSQPLEQQQKQHIAREFNYSETVILHEGAECYQKREWSFDIFTTSSEIPFAGHPTIGTIVYLGKTLQSTGSTGIIKGTLLAKAGRLPFTYDTQSEVASAEIPHDSHVHQKTLDARSLETLGANRKVSIGINRPAAIVSIVKGMTFGLVELSSLDALESVAASYQAVDTDGLDPHYVMTGHCGLLFYHITQHNREMTKIRTRMILESLEDPATGSASATLAVWLTLQRHRAGIQPGSLHRFEMTQGVEMGRRSVIGVDVVLTDDGAVSKVVLYGNAVDVMQGSLHVP